MTTTDASPVSSTAESTFSGLPGNGFTSFSSTATDSVAPWFDCAITSSFALASWRVDAVTVTVIVASAGVVVPSSALTVNRACVPLAVSAAAETFSAVPSMDAVRPCGTDPFSRKVSLPWSSGSGSVASAARSSEAASSPGATFMVAPTIVGGWLSGGSTVIGIVRVALRPSGSSGPVPSVTSKVIASVPK